MSQKIESINQVKTFFVSVAFRFSAAELEAVRVPGRSLPDCFSRLVHKNEGLCAFDLAAVLPKGSIKRGEAVIGQRAVHSTDIKLEPPAAGADLVPGNAFYSQSVLYEVQVDEA